MESCPGDFSALFVDAYFKKPAEVFNQSLCVPSVDLKAPGLVSPIWLACACLPLNSQMFVLSDFGERNILTALNVAKET